MKKPYAKHTHEKVKAYIVAVDMGYGHLRAAYPFLEYAATPLEWKLPKPAIILANDYPGISFFDKLIWQGTRKIYEWFSLTSTIPFIGKYIFNVLDYIQRIEPFYPKRDLSKPKLQTKLLYGVIKRGHGRHLIEMLDKKPLPFFTTFFVPAFFAEEHGYKGEIYCLCTDTDISRAWAPLYPKRSRIIYCAPNHRVKERLIMYGVRPEKIITTGFPIPKEIFGSESGLEILRTSLARRIGKLDPCGVYQKKYIAIISRELGAKYPVVRTGPLTITYAVGGAGAQLKIGIAILKSLLQDIRGGKVKLNLVAGSSLRVYKRYERAAKKLGMRGGRDIGVKIIYYPDKFEYFKEFSKIIVETDILWTKPSELSFYAGAGLPIIIAPPLGSHEKCNRAWLYAHGAGFDQHNPRFTNEWLKVWLDGGILAEAAMNGFINISKSGTFNLEDLILRGKRTEIENVHLH